MLGVLLLWGCAAEPLLPGLLLEEFASSHALGAPSNSSVVPLAQASVQGGAGVLSLRLIGTWTPTDAVDILVECSTPGLASDHLIVWIDDHTVCDTHAWTGWQGPAVGPAGIRLSAMKAVMVRAELHRAAQNESAALALSITRKNGLALAPSSELSPEVPALQQRRLSMQRGLLQGWDSWWSTIGAQPGFRGGMLSVALMPESFAITFALCQLSTGRCVSEATVAGTLTHDTVRPGVKARNASYAELWATAPGGLNVSIQWAAGPCSLGDERPRPSGGKWVSCSGPGYNQQLLALVTGLPNASQAKNLSDWAVAVGARTICWNGEQGLCTSGKIEVRNTQGKI